MAVNVTHRNIRPGVRIEFKTVPRMDAWFGDLGIAAIPLQLPWGADNSVISVLSTDLISGVASLEKIGLNLQDPDIKLLRAMLSNCYNAKVFKLNSGGNKASVTLGDLTVTAKHPGTFGNEIVIRITTTDNILYTVFTFVKGTERNRQVVTVVEELENNAWVDFSGTGTFTANAGAPLVGGTNGSVASTAYALMQEELKVHPWNILAVPTNDITLKNSLLEYINVLRREENRFVQVVLANFSIANNERIISVENSAVINNEPFTPEEFTAWVAGARAGTPASQSLTGRIVVGANNIVNKMTHSEINQAIQQGKFVLSTNQDGAIKVEKDINTLQTFTDEKGEEFSNNQVIAILDKLAISIIRDFENDFLGRVPNNELGRSTYRSRVIGLLETAQINGEIQNFNGADDVEVMQGETLTSVVVNLHIMPVGAMEYLYVTINVHI